MLDEILKWMGAGDQAITAMGPVLTIILACIGGYAVTQTAKFPIAEFSLPSRAKWWTRGVSILATWLFAHYLGELPVMLEVLVALTQPVLYTLTMRIVRHRWPWLEATRTVGSADPSNQSLIAKIRRDDARK